ncbi:hypothetical protein ACLB2K_063777 [Fragaria x ananassa]
MSMASISSALLGSLLLILLVLPDHTNAHHRTSFRPGPWKHAHATFYEGGSGSFVSSVAPLEASKACEPSLPSRARRGNAWRLKPKSKGEVTSHQNRSPKARRGDLHDVVQEGYGLDTVALNDTLFNNGQSCGACYDIQRVDSPQWCKPGQPTLHVTATNHCPPNYNLPSDNGGWCNAPREHFDIAKLVFLNIAEYKAGIVPIIYRRVPCQKRGGIRFTITGNPYYNEVLVWNVGGAGDVISVQVKGDDKLKWTTMKRMWGQRWITDARLVGESLNLELKQVIKDARLHGTLPLRTGDLARPLKARTSDRKHSNRCIQLTTIHYEAKHHTALRYIHKANKEPFNIQIGLIRDIQ